MIKIFKTGAHIRRSALSYRALAPLFAQDITLTDRPAAADMYLFAHTLDIENAPRDVIDDWRQRQRPVVLLSEEPFWDTIWGARPLQDQVVYETKFGPLPVMQINFQNSDVFQFQRIPYYLLTHTRFADAYRKAFTRNAQRSAQDWLDEFAKRPVKTSFMFERRAEQFHDVHWPAADLIGLCAWRTHLAQACPDPETERLGRSWQGGLPRQMLDDWHADKLGQLDGRAQLIGAIENTHQPHYVTEKLFDAFACGALPLYYASPRHRAHSFGLPAQSWLNLYGRSPTQGAEEIANFRPDLEQAQAFGQAQQTLQALFTLQQHWSEERAAFKTRLMGALHRVLDKA